MHSTRLCRLGARSRKNDADADTKDSMTLQWVENANRLPTKSEAAGAKADKWVDVFQLFTTSPLPLKDEGHNTTLGDLSKRQGTLSNWFLNYLNDNRPGNAHRRAIRLYSAIFLAPRPQ